MFVESVKGFLETFAKSVLNADSISELDDLDDLKTRYLESFSLFIEESLLEHPIWVDGLDSKQVQRWGVYWYLIPPYLNEKSELLYGVELYVNAECILELNYQPAANLHISSQK